MEQTDSNQGEGGGGSGRKEGEGTIQRTCMNDPWIWPMVWGLTVEQGLSWAEERKQRRKN